MPQVFRLSSVARAVNNSTVTIKISFHELLSRLVDSTIVLTRRCYTPVQKGVFIMYVTKHGMIYFLHSY